MERRDLRLMLKDYRLTTAEILYRLPDHPSLLQSYVWQALDLVPGFPELQKFLGFWQSNLEGKLYRVRVATAGALRPAEFTFAEGEFRLH